MTGYVKMYDGLGRDAAPIARTFPGAQMVAGYVDGLYVWSTVEWDLFPKAKHVLISAIPGSQQAMTADAADCEGGDYTPAQAAAWAHAKKAAGYYRPTIYCNLSNADAVRVATGSLILGVDYDIWLAWYNGDPAQFEFADGRKAVAHQYEADISGGIADVSAVYDAEWPRRTAPQPARKEWREWVTAGDDSLAGLAAKLGYGPATLLADTAKHYGWFGDALGNYIKGVFEGTVKPTDPMPKGCRFWVYA